MSIWRITAESTPGASGVGNAINVFHVKSTSGAVADCNSAIVALKAFYDALVIWYPTGHPVTIGNSVVDLTMDPPGYVLATPLTSTPSGGTSCLPAQVAAVISWKTVFAGPSFRGRTYLGPLIPAACQTDGTLSPSMIINMNTAGLGIVTYNGGKPIGDGFGVYSQYHGKNADGTPKKRDTPLFNPITGRVSRLKAMTQRKRSG